MYSDPNVSLSNQHPYPNMVELVIGVEGDFAAGFDRIGVWGSSTTAVASEVDIIYIHDLCEISFS